MDTLTLDGKIYISSKRAAEITGYAKDYIGQLCREGRVEARLVGRNWYILDASIQEHRFGQFKDGQPETLYSSTEKNNEVQTESIQKTETNEPKEEEPEAQNISPIESSSDNEAIEDIQQAWKTWFMDRGAQTGVSPEEPVTKSEEVTLTEESLEKDQEIADGEVVPLHITEVEPQRESREALRVTETIIERKRPGMRRAFDTVLIVKAIALVLMLASVVIAIIGTGALDGSAGNDSLQSAVAKSIGGTSIIRQVTK